MSYSTLDQGSVVLRLEYSIADAVHQRGLLAVIGAALLAWWNRPRIPSDLPAYLRADIGLPPVETESHWINIPVNPARTPLWRPGM